jgi:hypothetical protein
MRLIARRVAFANFAIHPLRMHLSRGTTGLRALDVEKRQQPRIGFANFAYPL